MAWRMKLKLPSMKVTQRSTSGEVVHRIVPRGCSSQEKSEDCGGNFLTGTAGCGDAGDDQELGTGDSWNPLSHLSAREPSLHEIVQKAAVSAWKEIRPALLKASIECSAMPPHQRCIVCTDQVAKYRCLQCALWAYYCPQCFGEAHSRTKLFHTGEVWENGVFAPVVISDRTIDVRPLHECATANCVPLCCIDEYGTEHNVSFMCCQCEPLTVTMVRARLWPASPQRPTVAFTFELLDWAEALLLECQVALKDFCKALYFKCPHLVAKRKDIYSSLINAFEQYRWMKVELRHLSFLCPELDHGNVCPACPKNSGSLILSMDALFGLPRKKSAGCSYEDPLHGDIFFGNQNEVDEFVATSAIAQKTPKVCNDFLAGDTLRSSRRYHALDETALFGCACRHEFPKQFINLKHGERLSYGVWLLHEVLQSVPSNVTLYMMYDIACNLVRHMKATDGDYLRRAKFAIPSFHAYGHNAACQVLYSPLRCEGIGLSDGEVMERLWSYLRRFGRMTKEMRPSHRVDVLSHALVYYGSVTKQKLATLLVRRWTKATEMKKVAIQRYTSLISSLEGVSADVVEHWIDEEKVAMTSDITEQSVTSDWKNLYFHTLQSYYIAREQLVNANQSEVLFLRGRFFNLESQLADIERKSGIKSRWKMSDQEYVDSRRCFMIEKKSQLYACLWACVVKRHYLLRMKAKYADGQKIAKKLSVNITKETRRARQLLQNYNATCTQIDSQHSPLLAPEVLSPSSDFWQALPPKCRTSKDVPWEVQKNIIQAFLLTRRSDEEIQLLKADMHCTLTYWSERIGHISTKLQVLNSIADPQVYDIGAKCSLHRLLLEAELTHFKAVTAFSGIIEMPTAVTMLSANHVHSHLSQCDDGDDTSSVSSCSDSDFDEDDDVDDDL